MMAPVLALALVAGAPLKVATVPVLLEGAPIGLSGVDAAVDRALTWRPGLQGLRYDEIETLAPGAALAVRNCGSDRRCLADTLQSTGAQRALVIVVRPNQQQWVVTAQLVDLVAARVQASTSKNSTRDVAQTIQEVVGSVAEEGGYSLAGGLSVVVEPPEAQIQLDGAEPIQQEQLRYVLTPGAYRIQATAPGYDPSEKNISIVPSEELALRMQLEKQTSLVESPWLWIGVGAAVVVAGAVTAGAVIASGREQCTCISNDPTQCPAACP